VIKGIVIGFILAIAISVGCVFIYFSSGMATVATADAPMPFEKKFANMALDAHIEKQHIPPLLCLRTNLIFLPVRTYTNSTAPSVRDFEADTRRLCDNDVSQTATIVSRQGCNR